MTSCNVMQTSKCVFGYSGNSEKQCSSNRMFQKPLKPHKVCHPIAHLQFRCTSQGVLENLFNLRKYCNLTVPVLGSLLECVQQCFGHLLMPCSFTEHIFVKFVIRIKLTSYLSLRVVELMRFGLNPLNSIQLIIVAVL